MAIEQLTPPEHVTHDVRERASEVLGRIVTSTDMTEMTPLAFSLAEYTARSRARPVIRRLYPIAPGRPAPLEVVAIVERGGWVVPCPFCQGREYADPAEALFLCCSCWNQDVGGRPLIVVFPSPVEKAAIEDALLARPRGVNRNRLPGESIADLERENAERGIS